MKQKILISRTVFPDIIEKLQLYFDVEVNHSARYDAEGLKRALADKEAVLLAGGEIVNADTVKGLKKLRIVAVGAAGYNNVDVQALSSLGILVSNSPGRADETVADFTWGLLISLARNLPQGAAWIQEGQWQASAGNRFYGIDLFGKTIGILGLGGIGQAIARRAAGFNMNVIYHNRHRQPHAVELACRAIYRTKYELLNESDFVILALPLNSENYHIIGEQELNSMRREAILINIARGGLIDEQALAAAIKEQKIAGAGLDVFEMEPRVPPALMNLPNALLTPHIAGATLRTQHALIDLAADNIIAALGHGPFANHPPSLLNPELLNT